MRLLCSRGADINAFSKVGSRPITASAWYPDLYKLLSQYGTTTEVCSKYESGLSSLLTHASKLGFFSDTKPGNPCNIIPTVTELKTSTLEGFIGFDDSGANQALKP